MMMTNVNAAPEGVFIMLSVSSTKSIKPAGPVIMELAEWPIAQLVYPKDVRDEEVIAAHVKILGLLKREQLFCIVSDVSKCLPTRSQAEISERFIESNRKALREYVVAHALVVTNPIWRAALRTFMLAETPPFRMYVCGSVAEGKLWTRARLAEREGSHD